MMMNVGELNRASSQQCQPHARLLVSGSLSLGSSRKSGLLWGRSGACSVCLPSDLGLLPTAGRKEEGERQGQGQEAPASSQGPGTLAAGRAPWWGDE